MNAGSEQADPKHRVSVELLARWALGGLLLYVGIRKALDPVDFLKLVHQYHLVQGAPALNIIATLIPWWEILSGLLLLTNVAVRGTAFLTVLGVVPFTWVVLRRALELQAAQGIHFCSVRFDCGCGLGEVFICTKLAENALLIALAAWLTFRGVHQP